MILLTLLIELLLNLLFLESRLMITMSIVIVYEKIHICYADCNTNYFVFREKIFYSFMDSVLVLIYPKLGVIAIDTQAKCIIVRNWNIGVEGIYADLSLFLTKHCETM